MSTHDLTMETFQSTIGGDGIVLVDFWASWCGPCRAFGPIFDTASEQHPDITFTKVDTEAEQQLAGGLGISSIPTLMAFRDGVLLYAEAGALPAPELDKLITAVQDADMEQIRAELAQHQAQHQGHEGDPRGAQGEPQHAQRS